MLEEHAWYSGENLRSLNPKMLQAFAISVRALVFY